MILNFISWSSFIDLMWSWLKTCVVSHYVCCLNVSPSTHQIVINNSKLRCAKLIVHYMYMLIIHTLKLNHFKICLYYTYKYYSGYKNLSARRHLALFHPVEWLTALGWFKVHRSTVMKDNSYCTLILRLQTKFIKCP